MRRYPWSKLESEGDVVLVPSTSGDVVVAKDVSTSAHVYVSRRHGPSAVVTCTTTPRGVFVALAYVPDAPIPDPQPGDPEPIAPARSAKVDVDRHKRADVDERYSYTFDDEDDDIDEGPAFGPRDEE